MTDMTPIGILAPRNYCIRIVRIVRVHLDIMKRRDTMTRFTFAYVLIRGGIKVMTPKTLITVIESQTGAVVSLVVGKNKQA
jgi:hypothetical protein